MCPTAFLTHPFKFSSDDRTSTSPIRFPAEQEPVKRGELLTPQLLLSVREKQDFLRMS